MKTAVGGIAIVALLVGGWFAYRAYGPGATPPVPAANRASEITYICLETGELSHGPRVETPAVNPKLGRPTLVQALYCEQCHSWYRMPPREILDRMPMGPVCPKLRHPLREVAPAGTP
ncbi:MAG: hypothetical protein NT069_24230, partial [Planctomycetota bacterium]|nr:hypothetical protein [Planctomycetota bacterium]